MFSYIEIDEKLRKIFSYAFRVIIVVFSIYVISFSNNYFEWYFYLIGAACYLIIFSILKRNGFHKLRLINDYLYIFFVCYGKDIADVGVVIFVMLPVINSPNHSGSSSSPLLVISLAFGIITYLVRDMLFVDNFSVITKVIFLVTPAALIFVILFFEWFRVMLFRLSEKFNYETDRYYETNLKAIHKPHRILRSITELINSVSLMSFRTDRLVCFKLVDKKLTVIGSTKFVFHYKISNRDKFLNDLIKGSVENHPIEIDEVEYTNNISYKVRTPNCDFVFVLITNRPFHIFHESLLPAIHRMARILAFEDSMISQKNKYMDKVKNKIEFVDDAQTAMHFIKNKLNPLANFIAIAEEYELLDDQEKKDWFPFFKKEREKVKANLPLIIEKAQKFHQNTNSPYSISDFQVTGLKKLLAIVRINWSNYFDDDKIVISVNRDTVDTYGLELNEDLLDFLLTNWISNMKKHSDGRVGLKVEESEKDIQLIFSNGITQSRKTAASDFVRDFNAVDRDEIVNRGSSRGLREMKYFLRTMQLNNKLTINGQQIDFLLIFRKKYESSNN